MKLTRLKPTLKQLDSSIAKSPTATARIRGGNLQRRNRMMKMRNPLCVICDAMGITTEATEFDHVVPLANGGGEHEGNLQGLCEKHHRMKTELEAHDRSTY